MEFPRVRLVSVRKKSFPLFGRVTGMQWEFANPRKGHLRPDLAVPGHAQMDRDISLRIVERLAQDPATTAALISSGTEICIATDPDCGCWILAADDRPMTKWTKPLWGCCQAVAARLLAMPMPTVDQ